MFLSPAQASKSHPWKSTHRCCPTIHSLSPPPTSMKVPDYTVCRLARRNWRSLDVVLFCSYETCSNRLSCRRHRLMSNCRWTNSLLQRHSEIPSRCRPACATADDQLSSRRSLSSTLVRWWVSSGESEDSAVRSKVSSLYMYVTTYRKRSLDGASSSAVWESCCSWRLMRSGQRRSHRVKPVKVTRGPCGRRSMHCWQPALGNTVSIPADTFATFFTQKVDTIRASTSQAPGASVRHLPCVIVRDRQTTQESPSEAVFSWSWPKMVN